MEADAHIITCADDMAKNMVKCVERCELNADQLIFSALASSYAVLTDDERELGVCVVDIGGGTMDMVIYTDGAIRHTAVIPVAGNQITSDIAKIFRTPISNAEEIKVNYACALKDMVSMEDSIEVPSVGGRPARVMSRHTLAEVLNLAIKSFLSWYMMKFVPAVWKSKSLQALCLQAVPLRWKVPWNLPKNFSRCPCAWANPST